MTNQSEVFEYSAFISYRHVPFDRKWAKWLLNAIETYRVPKPLQARGFPARLGKIFRDEDEIPASADLSEQIKQALEKSRFLIVICSKDTPESRWVGEEIRTFHALGRSDRILVLLVDGEPDEAFPEILLKVPDKITDDGEIIWKDEEREPIAADVRSRDDASDKELKRNALLRMAAALLGVKFDDLRQRDRQRQIKKQRSILAATLTALVLIASGGFYWWDQTRIKTSYFANQATRWGVPFGIGKLDAATAGKRGKSYRFNTRGGRVIAMQIVNGSGTLTADPKQQGASQWIVSYGDDKLQNIRLLDKNDKQIRLEKYEFGDERKQAVIIFRAGAGRAFTQGAQAGLLGLVRGTETTQKTEITQNRIFFDVQGLIVRRLFEDFYGTPRSDATGTYGKAYQRNEKGLVTTERPIGQDGNALVLKNGIAYEQQEFSSQGDVTSISWHDENGALMFSDAGYAKKTYQLDSVGNVVGARYLDSQGQLSLVKDGYARYTSKYDARGNSVEWAYFGIDGKPVLRKNGYALLTLKYDARGNSVEWATFGIDGKPVLRKNGYALLTQKYDARGNPVEGATFGIDGKPILRKEGYARYTSKYDASGNLVEQAYFGIDGKPVLRKNGYALLTQKYDARGNLVEGATFGIDGKPVLIKDGYARYTSKYDARGNMVELATFGIDGKPILRKEDYARYTSKYDSRGNLVEQAYFGIDGKPVLIKDGYALPTQKNDARGNRVEQAYFGIDGKPVLHKDGNALFTQKYDARGNRVEQAYFGIDGKPVLIKNGYAILTQKYDARGNLVEQAYFSIDGKPVLVKNGYAILTQKYDARGNLVEGAYFGIDGMPVLIKDGYARYTSKYDARGNLVEVATFGIDGKPILIKDGYALATQKNDARGNLVEQAYFDIDGKPVLIKDGYVLLTQIYDTRGNLVAQFYYGIEGRLLQYKSIFANRMKGQAATLKKLVAARRYDRLVPVISAYLDQAHQARRIGAFSDDAISSVYLNAAWFYIFARKFENAVDISRKALKLTPKKIILQTNLASALMFLGKDDEARKIFLSNRGRILPNKTRWEDGILGDFRAFRKNGLSHPLMDEILMKFQETQKPSNTKPDKVLEAQ